MSGNIVLYVSIPVIAFFTAFMAIIGAYLAAEVVGKIEDRQYKKLSKKK